MNQVAMANVIDYDNWYMAGLFRPANSLGRVVEADDRVRPFVFHDAHARDAIGGLGSVEGSVCFLSWL